MNPFTIAIAGILFVLGIVVGRQTIPDLSDSQKEQSLVQTVKPTDSITIATISAEPTIQIATVSGQKDQSIDERSFLYPNGTIRSSTQKIKEITTTDDIDMVVSWYKKLLVDYGYSISSEQKSPTQHIVNGTTEQSRIQIRMTKKQKENIVHINIDLLPEQNKKDSSETATTSAKKSAY